LNRQEFQAYIEDKIPLVGKAGFKVTELGPERVVVRGDFDENRNHHNTVFGGSISVILTLASWALVQERMNRIDPDARIVIARQSIDYLRPAVGDFTGECNAPGNDAWKSFLDSYRHKGAGRIMIEAGLMQEGKICARFEGEFHVSLPEKGPKTGGG